MPATGITTLSSAIPNFSLAALIRTRRIPITPALPTIAKTPSSTLVAASIQPRKPTSTMPVNAAAMITASIERRPSFSQ